jgi:hypothetical protein
VQKRQRRLTLLVDFVLHAIRYIHPALLAAFIARHRKHTVWLQQCSHPLLAHCLLRELVGDQQVCSTQLGHRLQCEKAWITWTGPD